MKRTIQDDEYVYIKILVKQKQMITCVKFMDEEEDEDSKNPPYKIKNDTVHEITYKQKIKVQKSKRGQQIDGKANKI